MRALALCFLAAAACSPYSPDLGAAPFLCGSAAPVCPDGYSCNMGGGSGGVCTKNGGSGVPVDGTPSNCADDHTLEPNDSITMAWQTPVDTRKNFPLTMLAICPAGDKDTYSMAITVANENVEVLIDFDVSGAALQGAILNAGGTAIQNAMPITGSPGHIRAYVANLPVGTYYAQVFGPNSGTPATNNYNLTINVTGP
ncbi:MAG: hypothetical protein JO257_23095 [Deltaproteobacteria bacterium]|nr:hypothetical protein [Deltaproteobacteria bacterium]